MYVHHRIHSQPEKQSPWRVKSMTPEVAETIKQQIQQQLDILETPPTYTWLVNLVWQIIDQTVGHEVSTDQLAGEYAAVEILFLKRLQLRIAAASYKFPALTEPTLSP